MGLILALLLSGWVVWQRDRGRPTGKGSSQWPWEIAGRLALLAFGVALALITAEVALRFIVPPWGGAIAGDLNPWVQYVGWAGNPYQTRFNTKFQTVIQYNSKGLRDVEHTYEKPPETFRILILGDSFVEAEQIGNLEETFPRLLEGLLNQHRWSDGAQFEVIAVGFSGWGTDQQSLFYQYEGYKYHPDLVLLNFTSNDVADNYAPFKIRQTGWPKGCVLKPYFKLEGEHLVLENFPYSRLTVRATDEQELVATLGLFARFKSYLYEHLHVYRLVVNTVLANSPRLTRVLTWAGFMPVGGNETPSRCWQAAKIPGDPQVNTRVYHTYYSEEDEKAWALTKALIRELRDVTASHDVRLVVVNNAQSIATANFRSEKTSYTDADGVVWDMGKPDRLLEDLCQREGLPFMTLQPVFDQSPYAGDGELYAPKDGHYGLVGHRLAAQTIYEWFVGNSLVP